MNTRPSTFDLVFAASSDDNCIAIAAAQVIPMPDKAEDPLPDKIVWMPRGEHEISGCDVAGKPWQGKVICDEAGAHAVAAMLAQVLASGRRVYLDKNHDDGEATAWITAFTWDPAQGIMAHVAWTSLGESLLRGRVFYSFSPAFLINRKTGRVSGFPAGHAAGGLVNAPAFGPAMPALIAARLARFPTTQPASGGSPDNNQKNKAMQSMLIKLLAALGVTVLSDATEEQLVALAAKHLDQLPIAGAESLAAKAQLSELVTLRAADAARRKADAKAATDAAVARGAIPAKDEAIQGKWRNMIEANPDHAELLVALPANPALTRVTEPGGAIQVKDNLVPILQQLAAKKSPDERAVIYARDIGPILAKPGFSIGPILAANTLGTLSGELITQRSLTLLKRTFPELFAISTDFSDVGAAFNQTVKARLRTIPTVTDYSATTGYATSAAGTTDVPVVINGHKAVQIAFNANELASTNRDLFGEQVEGAHNAIGADLVDALLALITAGNYANATIQAVAGFGRATMTTIAKALSTRLVPRADRFAMLNLDYFERLGQDSAIVSLATFQQAEVITENRLPRVGGMQPHEVQNFPVAGNLVGFCGTPDAIAVATRIPNDYTLAMPDVGGGGVVQIVKNLDTGISVMLVRYIDHKLGAAVWRLAYMRGAGVGQAASGQRITSI